MPFYPLKRGTEILLKGNNEISVGFFSFYLPKNSNDSVNNAFFSALFEADNIFVVKHYTDEDSNAFFYVGFVKGFAFDFSSNAASGFRFSINNIYPKNDRRYHLRKEELYSTYYLSVKCKDSKFLIISSVGNKVSAHKNIDSDPNSIQWDMTPEDFNAIDIAFTKYEADNELYSNAYSSEAIKNMEDKVLNKLNSYINSQDMTDKHNHYLNQEFYDYSGFAVSEKNNAGGSEFVFYVTSQLNQQKDDLKENTLLEIRTSKESERAVATGMLVRIENNAAVISFKNADTSILPQQGCFTVKYNSRQTKVRRDVLKKIYSDSVPSKYMYRLFSSWSVGGYTDYSDEETEHIVDFIADKYNNSKYPPNIMQLEAILKGIYTDDILMVQGPPGTGKTTIIKSWVQYFTSRNKRVLIASQNNAAVDNVLAGLDGSINILRLGSNPNKIQENCHKYMIENKKAEIKRQFDSSLSSSYSSIKNLMSCFSAIISSLNKLDSVRRDINIGSFHEKIKRLVAQIGIIQEIAGQLKELENEKQITVNNISSISNLSEEQDFERKLDDINQRISYMSRRLESENSRKREIAEDIRQYKSSDVVVRNEAEYSALISQIENYTASINAEKLMLNQERLDSIDIFLSTIEVYKREYNGLFGKESAGNISMPNSAALLNWCVDTAKELSVTAQALDFWSRLFEKNYTDILNTLIVGASKVVGATCIGIANYLYQDVDFDVAIIDESGQIQLHNVIVPMAKAPKVLMLGDHKQIPPIADEDTTEAIRSDLFDNEDDSYEDAADSYVNSFFEIMFNSTERKILIQDKKKGRYKNDKKLIKPVLSVPTAPVTRSDILSMISAIKDDPKKTVKLNTQFRMPGDISEVISQWFYNNNYLSGYSMKNFSPVLSLGREYEVPFIILSTSNRENRYEKPGTNGGYYNEFEASLISELIRKIQQTRTGDEFIELCSKPEIGIISAYSAQKNEIRKQLKKDFPELQGSFVNAMVNSLDSFQGQERDLIIYSFTRSTDYKSPEKARVGFMKELRRLNVAFTRAKKQLILIGDMEYLQNCNFMSMNENEICENEEYLGQPVDAEMIERCENCGVKVCERKFSLFMQLVTSYVTEKSQTDTYSENGQKGCVFLNV